MSAIVDPTKSAFWVANVGDQTWKNLDFAGVFGLRSCHRIVVDGGKVGPSVGPGCLVGALPGKEASTDITIRGVLFHDLTPTNPDVDHHEGLYVSCVDGILLDGCRFEHDYGNTADLFFTGWEAATPLTATNVVVRGCYFGRPTNGKGNSAIQWNDTSSPATNYLIEGNLFDGAEITFGTLKKPVKNFRVGVNYGDLSQAQHDYAVGMGVTFDEYPFRPAAQWPGAAAEPAPTPAPVPAPAPTPIPVPAPPVVAPVFVTVTEAGVSAAKLGAALAKHGSPIILTSNGKPVATVTGR